MSRPRQLLLAFSLYGAVLVIAGCWDREPTAANNPPKPADARTPPPSPPGSDVSIQPVPATDPLASNPGQMPVAPGPEGPADPSTKSNDPAMVGNPPQLSPPPTGVQPNPGPMNLDANPPGTSVTAETAKPEERYGKDKPVDPIATNGPIFQGWPQPRLALVITGEQHGYLEPCGCAGLENMKGGLKRRMTFLNQLRADGWPVVAVDLGDMVRRFGKQAEMKFHASMDALRAMKYSGVALGPTDLRLPATELVSDIGNQDNGLVMANVGVFGFDIPDLLPRYRIVEAGGIKVGITAVLGEKYLQQVASPDIETQPAAEALRGVLEKLGNQCQVLVLLSHGTVEEATALAKQFPRFNVVATAGGASLPPAEPGKVEGTNTWLIEVGQKGMYAGVVGYYGNDLQDRRFQRVPIDSRFKDAAPILQQHIAFQDQLEQLGWAGLGVKTSPHGSGREFVGSDTCGQCHTKAFAIWKDTPHAKAMTTLVNLNPPRQFDPECVSCHATGWEPQKYFPFESGFMSLEATPHLAGNGCENCHGPGAKHADAELGNIDVTEAELAMLRDQMKLPLAKADEACRKCHDLDNSPDYVKNGLEAYWPAVEHKGKD